MIQSWIQIFLRLLKKKPLYPIINTFGLTLGITCFILVMLLVSHETSYEKWNPNLENIYSPIRLFDDGDVWTSTPSVLSKKAKEELPEVTDYLLYNWGWKNLVEYNGKSLMRGTTQASANFFEFYPYPFKYGDVATALTKDTDIVITEEVATELFGDINPVGKLVKLNKDKSYTITGVYITKNHPSDTQPSIIKLLPKPTGTQWGNFSYNGLYKIAPGTDIEKFIAKFDAFYDENAAKSWESREAYFKDKREKMYIENLADVHLFSKALKGRGANTLFILSLLAFLILLISSINFINLSIAGATQRAKEVAVRKTLGTNKGSIVQQFTFEVFIQCIAAIIISFALVEILLSGFNTLMNTELSIFNPYNRWLLVVSVIGILILISGVFPGIYLSNFSPIKVLKGNFSRSKSGNTLKKSMLIIQFVISAIFLMSSLIIKAQLEYMNNKDLGFSKDQVVLFPISQFKDSWQRFDTYKQEISKIAGVSGVTTTNRPPGTNGDNGANSDVTYRELSFQTDMHYIDKDYIPTMKIKLIEGENFRKSSHSENETNSILDKDGDTIFTNNILVNKKFIEVFGLENPIGTKIQYWDSQGEIIGVINNYISKGFDAVDIPSLYMTYVDENDSWIKPQHVLVKLNGENTAKTIAAIEAFWTSKIEPDYPFRYEFLDQNFSKLFTQQQQLEKLVSTLSMIMIFISLLGLFAIATHTVQQRYKEVAIRKTLGATEKQLIYNLIKDFIVIAAIATIIAMPIAYYLSSRWLQDFVYRIDIPILPFIITPIIIMALTTIIIYLQAKKALKLDLVANLKYE